MGRHSKPDPSHICKFLSGHDDDCTSIMQIPSPLVKSYGEVLPQEATLKIDESGKSWKVKIEKFKGHYFFTDGWEKFAKDVDVASREYLHFKSPSPSIQHHNSDSSGYLSGDSDSEDTFSDQEDGSDVGTWKFCKELQKHHAYRVDIPKDFVRGSGIAGCREIKLLDDKGRIWPVRVTGRGGKFSMSGGWYNFLTGNEVVVGSTLLFTIISSSDKNTIEARVVKKGTNETELFKLVNRKKAGSYELTDSSHKTNKDHLSKGEIGSSVGPRRWKFTKEIKKHHEYSLDIPCEFARGTGITKTREIKLVDGKGRKWAVAVKYRKCGVYAVFGGGWNDFLVGNKVGVGGTILFQWNPSSSGNLLIEAKLLSNGRKKNAVFVKREGKGKTSELS